MRTLIRLEGLAILAAGIVGFYHTDYSWWLFAALILTPDIGMLGYLWNTKIGAVTYNIFHHLLIAAMVVVIGHFTDINIILMYGWIMVAHIGMDRTVGYGLKYPGAFKSTHLDKL